MGDIKQAILYHKQSIRILEKLYGVDNPHTGQAYTTLGFFYFSQKKYQKAFDNMLKSLFVFNMIGGEFVNQMSFLIFSTLNAR